jgi:hypothetical protein
MAAEQMVSGTPIFHDEPRPKGPRPQRPHPIGCPPLPTIEIDDQRLGRARINAPDGGQPSGE